MRSRLNDIPYTLKNSIERKKNTERVTRKIEAAIFLSQRRCEKKFRKIIKEMRQIKTACISALDERVRKLPAVIKESSL
jgi:hypothetical protein